jgi:hypothetical protein
VLAELARVGAAMMALFTALWFFAAPAAQQERPVTVETARRATHSLLTAAWAATAAILAPQAAAALVVPAAPVESAAPMARAARLAPRSLALQATAATAATALLR